MKKKSFIEEPVKGLRRLKFLASGYKVFSQEKEGLAMELALEEGQKLSIAGGGPIGILIDVDNLRTIQIGDQTTSLLTFEPAGFKFTIEGDIARFFRLDPDNNFVEAYRFNLQKFGFFVIGERRNRIEVWIPRAATGC